MVSRHNLDNVLEAIDLSARRVVSVTKPGFSTVGDRRVFERLHRSTVKPPWPSLAHHRCTCAAFATNAPDITPAELVELGEIYAAAPLPIQYQWTLLEGSMTRIRAGRDRTSAGRQIRSDEPDPYNRVDGFDFRRTSWERAAEMARSLHDAASSPRCAVGRQDVDGGCGQLRRGRWGSEGTLPGCAQQPIHPQIPAAGFHPEILFAHTDSFARISIN